MIPALRQAYNDRFTQEKYQAFLRDLNQAHQPLQFRMSETPVFVPRDFRDQMFSACEAFVDLIKRPDFKHQTQGAIPQRLHVPDEDGYPQCLVFDFGVCRNASGGLEPQLIEMQGFPSLFAYQVLVDDVFSRHFVTPPGFSSYLSGLDRHSYLTMFRNLLLGGQDPENVILLEIFPHQQKTNVDFYCTQNFTGVQPVCITELIRKGKQLFYTKNGRTIPVKRIYNRVIFDELLQQSTEVQQQASLLFEPLDLEWVPHPNWFYRLSKYTLPLISHPFVPQTWYLDQLESLPADLENYVLKPLFSFAGQGVVIDLTAEDIVAVKDPQNWILQKKVEYAPVIATPDGTAKAEIRIFYFWETGADRPVPVNSLARLSKGKMIGVRYNKDKPWTGGSFCLFEK
ncbi:hypothetical protein GCM10027051_15940 [Niabella terrae]